MNGQQVKEILTDVFTYPPVNATEAQTLLDRFWKGNLNIPTEKQRSILEALNALVTNEMGGNHAMDIKRQQRTRGQSMRKHRTGSRHG